AVLPEVFEHARQRRRVRVTFHGGRQEPEGPLDTGRQDRVLVPVVLVEGRPADVGALENVADANPVVGPLEEQAGERLEQRARRPRLSRSPPATRPSRAVPVPGQSRRAVRKRTTAPPPLATRRGQALRSRSLRKERALSTESTAPASTRAPGAFIVVASVASVL